MVSPTTIVHITPGPQTIQVGDTVVYHAWGETAAGDSVPVTGTWVTDRTDIVTLLGGEASDSVRVVGRFPGGGVAHISLDPATIIRMDVAAVETGFLPVDADPSASTWEDLIWDRMPRFTALGQTIQACAYALSRDLEYLYKSSPVCPDPPSVQLTGTQWSLLKDRYST